jgi:hypothetical protein
MATFSGAMKQLQSSVSDLAIDLGNALIPALAIFVKMIKGAVDIVRAIPGPMKDLIGISIGLGGALLVAAGALAIFTAKAWPAIFASEALLTAFTYGALVVAPFAIALGWIVAALASFTVAYKVTQGLLGENTPLIATASDTWDTLTESVRGFTTTLVNSLATGIDLILKFIATVTGIRAAGAVFDFFGANIDVFGKIESITHGIANAFSESAVEAEGFAEQVKKLKPLMQDLPSVQIEFKPVVEKATLSKWEKAIRAGLKDAAEGEFDAKVDLAVDKIRLKSGALKGTDLENFFSTALQAGIEKAQIKKVQRAQGGSFREAELLVGQANALKKVFGEFADGLDEIEIADLGFEGLSKLKKEILSEREQKEFQKIADEIIDAEEKEKIKAAKAEHDAHMKRLKAATEATKKANEKQAKITEAAIGSSLDGLGKLFAGDFAGALRAGFDGAMAGVAGALDAAGMSVGIPPGMVSAAADLVFGMITNVIDAVKDAIGSVAGLATDLTSGIFDSLIDGIGDQRLSGAVDFVGKAFGNIVDVSKKLGTSLAGLVAAMLPLIGPTIAIGLVLSSLAVTLAVFSLGLGASLVPLIATVGVIVSAWALAAVAVVGAAVVLGVALSAAGAVVAAAIGGLVSALAAAVASLSIVGLAISTITVALSAASTMIGTAVAGLVAALSTGFAFAGAVASAVIGFFSAIFSAIGAAISSAIGMLVAVFTVASAAVGAVISGFVAMFSGVIAVVSAGIGMVLSAFAAVFSVAGAAVSAAIGAVAGLFASIASAVGAVVGTITAAVSAVGAFVGALLSAVAGLGLAVALAGVFAFLATKTEAFGRIQDRFGKSIDRLVGALEPAVASLEPLAGIFDAVVTALIPFATQLGGIVILFKEEIFAAVKFLAISFLTLAVAGLTASNALIDFSIGILNALGGLLTAIDTGLESLGLDAQFTDFVKGLDDAAGELSNFKVDTLSMRNAIQELDRTTMSSVEQEFRRQKLADMRNGDARQQAKEKALAAANKKAGIAVDGAADAASGLTESLTNVPEGFKITRERFEALDPATPTTAPRRYSTPRSKLPTC